MWQNLTELERELETDKSPTVGENVNAYINTHIFPCYATFPHFQKKFMIDYISKDDPKILNSIYYIIF
jgi:hypothetical protein